ncbi:MAG: endonuclease [Bacteroidales bacterium]|jgi:endonuclease I|nr:endonuclease [Bacteroidales bacterium]
MKKLSLFVWICLSAYYIFAQIPANYYNEAQNKKGYALRYALFNIIKNHTTLSYDYLWTAYAQTDIKTNGKVWDMYSDKPGQNPPYEFTYGSDQCGNYGGEGDCYNREHSIPKSWFNDASPMVTDLIHVVPTDGYVNGKRSNYPFGEVASASWTSQNGSKLGSSAVSGYSGTVFEPIDEYKGDFARIYFYMTVCYMNKNLGATSNSMFTSGNLKPWALSMLIQWSNEDPVSEKEIARNNAVYQIQGNRNPFVDYPELVGKIYGSDSVNVFLPTSISEFEQLNEIQFSNPATQNVKIFYHSDREWSTESKLIIFDLRGRILIQKSLADRPQSIDVSSITPGVYILKMEDIPYVKVYKLIIQ